jgi:hypothetical protein
LLISRYTFKHSAFCGARIDCLVAAASATRPAVGAVTRAAALQQGTALRVTFNDVAPIVLHATLTRDARALINHRAHHSVAPTAADASTSNAFKTEIQCREHNKAGTFLLSFLEFQN